jgi:hypothetical protein
MLKVLGWDVSFGDKCFPFQQIFCGLGVEFNLARSSEMIITVSNKQSRIIALQEAVAQVTATGTLPPDEAASLRGKFLYAAGQLFGKTATCSLYVLGLRARQTAGCFKVGEELLEALVWLANHIANARARIVPMPDGSSPVHVFTDGAFEPVGDWYLATCGGVLISSGKWLFFGCTIPDSLVRVWLSGGGVQAISQVELIPVLLASRIWQPMLVQRKAIFWLDNDASREGLVRGFSPNVHNRKIISRVSELELSDPCFPWYSRVPTKSNVADAPSRGEYSELLDRGAERCSVPDSAFREVL